MPKNKWEAQQQKILAQLAELQNSSQSISTRQVNRLELELKSLEQTYSQDSIYLFHHWIKKMVGF